MPTKDKAKANEQAKVRMQRYRERCNEGLTVTPDKEVTPSEANEAVTPDLSDVTPVTPFSVALSPIKAASECEDAEDSPIVADLIRRGKAQKGFKIGHGLPFGKDKQAKGKMRELCQGIAKP